MTLLADTLLMASGSFTPKLVQIGSISTFAATLPQSTAAGHLLIAFVTGDDGSGAQPTTTASGWSTAVEGGEGYNTVAIWYKANCGANESVPEFTSPGSVTFLQFAEFSDVATTNPLISSGSSTSGTASNAVSDTSSGALLIGLASWNTSNTPTILGSAATDSSGNNVSLSNSNNLGGNGLILLSSYGVCGATGSDTDTFIASENVFPGQSSIAVASFAAS